MKQTKSFAPWALGAPLYMPGNRRDIMEIANGEKYSMLFDVTGNVNIFLMINTTTSNSIHHFWLSCSHVSVQYPQQVVTKGKSVLL